VNDYLVSILADLQIRSFEKKYTSGMASNTEGSVADWLYCTPFLSQPIKHKTVWVLVSETLPKSQKWFTWPLHLSKCRKVGCT
jgi:hypothetical protein